MKQTITNQRAQDRSKSSYLMTLKDRGALIEAFGIRVKTLREMKGYTPSQFEAHSGINAGNLAKYELGLREPRLVTIVWIAMGLGISHLDLLDFRKQLNLKPNKIIFEKRPRKRKYQKRMNDKLYAMFFKQKKKHN